MQILIMKKFFFSAILILPSFCFSQVVNIESQRLQSDSTGWLGGAGADFSYTDNGNQTISASAFSQIEYKAKKELWLILGEYSLFKGNGEDFINSSFGHLRYNRKFGKVLRWEAFTQLQYNEVTKINVRFLLGTGPRFKLMDKKKLKIYTASLYMFEYEEEADEFRTIHRQHRSSSYLTFTFTPTENISLISTTYYQPLFTFIGDYRILNQETIGVDLGKHFTISLKWNFLFDSRPVEGVPNRIISLNTGIEFIF